MSGENLPRPIKPHDAAAATVPGRANRPRIEARQLTGDGAHLQEQFRPQAWIQSDALWDVEQ